jgi:Ca-activated chloride channel family protein
LFADAGFRTPAGDAPPGLSTEKNGVSGEGVANVKTPSPEQVSELLRTWNAINLDTRMLTVFDVSGSMAEKGVNGKTRIESATEAASTALAMLPDTTEIGLWAFSNNKNPPQDWIELVPTGPLGEPLSGITRRKRLEGGVGQLSALAGGGTAVNETALAAYRRMQATYQPGKFNEVVLFTDGRNDDNSSISTATLIDTLKREADPARPVPIFTIGLGQEANMQALRQISEATGGEAYQAAQPQDIRSVLLSAIGQRRCRPNC